MGLLVLVINDNQRNRSILYGRIILAICFLSMVACSTTVKKTDEHLDVTIMDSETLDSEALDLRNLEQAADPVFDHDMRVTRVPAPKKEKYRTTPVVRELLKKSRQKFEQGDYPAAVNYIERGINISPNDPLLWQRLALIRFDQGDLQQAKQLAKKSNILAETNQDLRDVNEILIRRVERLLTQ